jgi:hypothetical protein
MTGTCVESSGRTDAGLARLKVRDMTDEQDLRAEAVRGLRRRRTFGRDVAAFVVVNALLIGVWYFTGHGYFWPGWVLLGWGVLLALHAWNVFGRAGGSITEAEIARETERLHGGQSAPVDGDQTRRADDEEDHADAA